MKVTIRNEEERDFRKVEEITREAFWNLYVPGCDEHYLVHVMRNHPDFIRELDFVAVADDEIIGNIMYAKSSLIDENGDRIDALTFGPVSVLPRYQKQGVGSALIQHSIKIASGQNYRAILIYGAPHNYCKHGFKSSKDFMISDPEGRFPYGLLALELRKGLLQGHSWKFHPSDVYGIDSNASNEFDRQFESRKKEYRHTQEEFSIACRAFLV
jgi:predicted N-acetyltransferase YhbS